MVLDVMLISKSFKLQNKIKIIKGLILSQIKLFNLTNSFAYLSVPEQTKQSKKAKVTSSS
jgi:hypothetical protein